MRIFVTLPPYRHVALKTMTPMDSASDRDGVHSVSLHAVRLGYCPQIGYHQYEFN